MARQSKSQGLALATFILLGLPLLAALPLAPAAASATPTPLALLPVTFPALEGGQVKVEIGSDAPSGAAMTFVGNQSAYVNFSVWWWDTGPASTANLWIDRGTAGVAVHTMTVVPGQSGVWSEGTQYRVSVSATDFGPGAHRWSYEFVGPGGTAVLPVDGSAFGSLVLDRAEMFLDQSLVVTATQTLSGGYASGTLATLRDVVEQAYVILDPQMAGHWSGVDVPYDYLDENHNITGPIALAISGQEVFVAQSGSQRVGFGDSGIFPLNSQPAHKQALALRGLLLASGLFNESDVVLAAEVVDVNGTAFHHPYLRVALRDGSELPGDGTADNDTWIDVDLWGADLATAVAFGKHYGHEDNTTADDVTWTPSQGWPPANDTAARQVLWPVFSNFSTATPSGTPLLFSVLQGTMYANATSPKAFTAFWNDEPIIFDGLSSNHTMFLDMRYTWSVNVSGLNGAGPIWIWNAPPGLLGTFRATLTTTDVLGNEDTRNIFFIIRAKTELRQAIPDGSFDEDSFLPFDLRGYFGDEDGFNTIGFTINVDDPHIFIDRSPATAPNFTFRSTPDWCGSGRVRINASDGPSPVVSASFNLTVRCLNDPPVLSGIPTVLNCVEDVPCILRNMSLLATDADGDVLTWGIDSQGVIDLWVDMANDSMVFTTRQPNVDGTYGALLTASDGSVSELWPLTFRFQPVNDAPFVNQTIPTQVIDEDAVNATLALEPFFADPDDTDLVGEVVADPGLQAGWIPALSAVWFHPVANYSGPTGFTLRVRDLANASVTVHVDVSVLPVNDPPNVIDVEPKGPVTGTEGDLLIFVVQVIDSDSPILTYTFLIDGEIYGSGTTATFEWQTDFFSSGFHQVKAVVADSAGANDTHTWQVQLANSNRAPSVTIRAPGKASFQAGETINLTAEGLDADGEALEYNWNFGGILQPMSGQNVSFSFTSAGNHTVKVTVSDGEATASASIVINVVYNRPPTCEELGNCPQPTCEQLGNCPPTPGPGAEAAVAAIVAAGAALALLARRRRDREA